MCCSLLLSPLCINVLPYSREHAKRQRYENGVDPIPNDISEAYISKWLHEHRDMLRPLEELECRRQRMLAHQEHNCSPPTGKKFNCEFLCLI